MALSKKVAQEFNNLIQGLPVLQYQKKSFIYQDGCSANGVYYIQEGMVGLYQTSNSGKESLLRTYGMHAFFGYRTLFTNQTYPSTARAMSDSLIVKVTVKDFVSLFKQAPLLSNHLMKEVCTELGDAEKRLTQFMSLGARKRIIDAMSYLFSSHPSYPWTYREIGEFSGTDTATTIRYCKELKNKNILQAHNRSPKPTCLKQLISLAQSE